MRKYLYFILAMGLRLVVAGQDLAVDGLFCEYRANPLGMDEMHPRLSWSLSSPKPDQYQSAYRVLIATSTESLARGKGDWWDSGKVTDSENINIVPVGSPLEPFTRYYWKVMVWDQHGRTKGWSQAGWFETGMLVAANWKGKWIGDGKPAPAKDEDFYKDDPAPVFRREFVVSKKIRSARLYICGLGYNEPSMNGEKVGNAVLDPAWTDYRHTVFYSVYDLGKMLHTGSNTLDVLLGNGWYNPLPLRFWGRINFREALSIGRPKVLANLRIVYMDGSVETVATDESWRVAESGILRNNVFLGERIDARVKLDFSKAAVAVDAPGGRLVAAMMPPIRSKRKFDVLAVTEPGPGVYVVDIGQNFAGWIGMKVRGRAGQEVHFRYGEILQPNGHVNGLTTVAGQIKEQWHVNGGPGAPPTAYQEDSYICRGDGQDVFQPHFTFHGFRYVEITGLDGRPARDDLWGVGLNTDVDAVGTFTCSDTLLNGIQEMVRNTFLSNLFSVQSDCPGREKQGYGGDIVATADAFMYNYDMSCFYPKTLGDFADAVRPNGGMTECAPYNGIADEGFGGGTGPIGWQLAFPFLQRELYTFYGNKRVLEEQYQRTVGLVELLRGKAKEGLIDWGIGDHEAVNPKHVPVTSGAFYYGHVKLLAELAGLLGRVDDERRWSGLADSIGVVFNMRYRQGDSGLYDTAANQTTQVFPLWWGLAKDPSRSFAELERLIDVDAHGHLSTGIFGTKMLFDVLRRWDRNDLAYRIVSQREFPGYAYMRDHGATTLIESWALTDQNSWNHPMFGSVSEWFYRGLAGINPAEDAYGMNKLLLRMRPVGGLTHVGATLSTVRGAVSSEWERQAGVLRWTVVIPPNVRAEVDVPAGVNDAVVLDGRVLDKGSWKEGFFRVAVVSGRHRFVVTSRIAAAAE
ncbi:MAG TPA: family 78 glycoside hydrolase catalytic domain [Puia sp.]|uniref:family 78 glycoside hydrolase catalytic domain n=1 Tax=Puia sp. TaxID=2045100 RepID=UPI002BEDEB1F|nr:family 78 glycoside hydrolase catalytic domain [Puia sp.]HVU94023.1 family 78 glycoside hydrolase catalytic domain [Puia sp.]